MILSVGRIAPIKNLDTLVYAAELLDDVPIVLVGGWDESGYKEELEHVGMGMDLTFTGPQPVSSVVDWYHKCTVHVNCCPTRGSLDKAPLEAMACGALSLSSVEGYRETFGIFADDLLFRFRDPGHLAGKLEMWLSTPAKVRYDIGQYLRAQVAKHHEHFTTPLWSSKRRPPAWL